MSRLDETTCVQLWSDGDRLYDVTRGSDNCLTLKGPDGYSVDIQADHLEQVIDCLRRVAAKPNCTESRAINPESDVQTYIDDFQRRRVVLSGHEDYAIVRMGPNGILLDDLEVASEVTISVRLWPAIRDAIDAVYREMTGAGDEK